MRHLTVKQVLRIHARAVQQFGDDPAVLDLGMIDSAVAQPRAGFGGRDLYPTLADKVAGKANVGRCPYSKISLQVFL